MKSNIVFLGMRSGVSKKGNSYTMCSFGLEDKIPSNGYQAINTFVSDEDLTSKLKQLKPLDVVEANLILANGSWILVDVY